MRQGGGGKVDWDGLQVLAVHVGVDVLHYIHVLPALASATHTIFATAFVFKHIKLSHVAPSQSSPALPHQPDLVDQRLHVGRRRYLQRLSHSATVTQPTLVPTTTPFATAFVL